MDPDYERETLAVEETHWWYRGRRRIIRDTVAALPLRSPARILDAGCGSARNLVELAAFGEVEGADPSEQSVEAARRRAVGPIAQAPVESLPYEDASFDLVTVLDVLEHLDDDRRALGELLRVTRPAGYLLATVPAYPRLWSSHDVLNQHRRRYTRGTLLEAAAGAGWRPLRTTHFNTLLFPAAALSRGLERFTQRDGRPLTSGFRKTPAWASPLLERFLLSEAALLRRGHRLPVGLSILGVFERA